ncbi:MAG: hypothetical protein KDC54_02115, partial [Lewinella sp.]|nr:hypothetical protein [Lewinella sp.]
MHRLILFLILSIPVLAISWRTLFDVRSHGFYRFLSWECILWLGVTNYRYWFVRPLSLPQLVSWVLLFLSIYFVVEGVRLLRKVRKADGTRQDDQLYEFEQTTDLVEEG